MNAEKEAGLTSLAQTAAVHEYEIAQLVPIAIALAEATPNRRITVHDLRTAAAARGIIPPRGKSRELSYLGAVFRRAGFKTTGEKIEHKTKGTHAKLIAVWCLPGAV